MKFAWTALMSLLVIVGCTTVTPAVSPSVEHSSTNENASKGEPVTLAMGFIPNVQFAPFYVALEKGYFAEEGIALTLDYGMEHDLIELVASNELQFAIASGDQALLGRSGGRPIRYVANWYRRFPVAVTSIEHDLTSPETLEGKTIGLPGMFGANYIGWLALAYATGLDTTDVTLEAIGFNQIPVLTEGKVDAAVVYAMNEPLQLQREGYSVSTVLVADYIDLVANGLITNDQTVQDNPDLVRRMVRAMLRGIAFSMQNPDEAFEITRLEKYGTGITAESAETQRAVLAAALEFWRNDAPGYVPESAWRDSERFMLNSGLLDAPVPLSDIYTTTFLPP